MASKDNNDSSPVSVPDDDLLYEQTLRRLKVEVDRGRTYDQALQSIADIDSVIRSEITEDFLKLLIAERHFGEGYGLDDIALLLDVSYAKIEAMRDYMLQEIGSSLSWRAKGYGSILIH